MQPSWLVVTLKRAMDLAGGAFGLAVFVLTYPLIGLLIKLESPGPILYWQERVGINRRDRRRNGRPDATGPGGAERRAADWGGKPFRILKYRTMRLDAEAGGPMLAQIGGDPRVTRVGRWLRALHIDEIPQFLNVVKGEMSLIGPRPERPHFTMQYGQTLPHYSDRTHLVRPGMTGLAQILLGYDDSPESVVRKSHYDLSYRAAFSSFSSWLKMEAWIFGNTLLYLCAKPRLAGVAPELKALRRAKLLPFQGRAEVSVGGNGHNRPATLVSVGFGRAARTLVLAGHDPAELAARIEALDFSGKPSPDFCVRLKEGMDLEDMGLLVRLAHKASSLGGRLSLRSPNRWVRKMLREIRLDAVVDVQYPPNSVRNFLTVDVECWFHAYHMRSVAPKCAWHLLPSRLERNMERLLELLRMHETKATFFVLGWVADRFPEVVRMIDREGHEIATHGYHHDMLTEMTPVGFESDLLRSLEAIGLDSSQRIRGHRASNFTLVKSTLWALDILAKHGFEYDSSIFPVGRKRYGMPDYPNRLPHELRLASGAVLKELPMSTWRLGRRLLPIGGGGYLRLYPHRLTERFIEKANVRGLPAMVYLHPWELDLEQDRRYLGLLKTFQHYVNLDTTEWKLDRLLQRFDFSPVAENLKLPRIQALFRRSPVRVPELLVDVRAPAATPTTVPLVPETVLGEDLDLETLAGRRAG